MTLEKSLITVDPDGDIIVKLSRSGQITPLLVSSKVLSLASPVFSRMFKSQFLEGLNKNGPGSGSPRLLPLPDEDEEAFILICRCLHHRMNDSAACENPSLNCLTELCTISDKWDFTAALTPAAELWLQRAAAATVGGLSLSDTASMITETPKGGGDDLNRFLLVAYILDAPLAFSRISWEILMRHTGPMATLPGLSDHELIPPNLLRSFRERKLALSLALIHAVDKVITRILRCNNFYSYSGIFFMYLRHFRLWSVSSLLDEHGIGAIIAETTTKTFPDGVFLTCRMPGCPCSPGRFKEALNEAVSTVVGARRGLCLRCVKSDGCGGEGIEECEFCGRRGLERGQL